MTEHERRAQQLWDAGKRAAAEFADLPNPGWPTVRIQLGPCESVEVVRAFAAAAGRAVERTVYLGDGKPYVIEHTRAVVGVVELTVQASRAATPEDSDAPGHLSGGFGRTAESNEVKAALGGAHG